MLYLQKNLDESGWAEAGGRGRRRGQEHPVLTTGTRRCFRHGPSQRSSQARNETGLQFLWLVHARWTCRGQGDAQEKRLRLGCSIDFPERNSTWRPEEQVRATWEERRLLPPLPPRMPPPPHSLGPREWKVPFLRIPQNGSWEPIAPASSAGKGAGTGPAGSTAPSPPLPHSELSLQARQLLGWRGGSLLRFRRLIWK